jgi:hypothetical protein
MVATFSRGRLRPLAVFRRPRDHLARAPNEGGVIVRGFVAAAKRLNDSVKRSCVFFLNDDAFVARSLTQIDCMT